MFSARFIFLLSMVATVPVWAADSPKQVQENLESLEAKKLEFEKNPSGAVVSIRLDGSREFTDQHLAQLAVFDQLESLAISHALHFSGSGFDAFADHQNLKHVRFGGTRFNDEGIAPLVAIKTLESVGFHHCGPTTDKLVLLQSLPRLSSVLLHNANMDGEAAIEIVSEIPTLQEVGIGEQILVADDLQPLKNLKQLKTLKLIGCLITPEELEKAKAAFPGVDVQWKKPNAGQLKKIEASQRKKNRR